MNNEEAPWRIHVTRHTEYVLGLSVFLDYDFDELSYELFQKNGLG